MDTPDKTTALFCCNFIDSLYRMQTEWLEDDKPDEKDFNWPYLSGLFTQHSDILWSEVVAQRRRYGPKIRYKKHRDWVPVGALGVKDKTLYIGFRGTLYNREWDTNVRFHPRPLAIHGKDFGLVHDGFGDAYESLANDLNEEARELIEASEVEDLVVTGHSLGAALATLAFVDIVSSGLLDLNKVSASLYLYGSPRLGNAAFCTKVNAISGSIYRFENVDDPVVKLPIERLFGFSHVGNAYALDMDTGSGMQNHLLPYYVMGMIKADPVLWV